MAGIYIHIPFCAAKCAYCDFLSFAGAEASWAAYTDALVGEINSAADPVLFDAPVETVFIGGGTPTALPTPFLSRVLQAVARFPLSPDAEITVEANPGTLTSAKLDALSAAGVNRLSLGLQAWQNTLLADVGRIHTKDAFVANFLAARRAGFAHINVDLIFSLPGQRMSQWVETLDQVTQLSPEHISAYSLSLEAGTPLWEKVQNGEVALPDDEADRAMYAACKTLLAEQGYQQYELSNFARAGHVCRHNIGYWVRKPYVGFGLGAHSFADGTRWHNTTDLTRYLSTAGVPGAESVAEVPSVVTEADAMAETMFLGLRMTAGIAVAAFRARFGVTPEAVYGPWLERMKNEGMLCCDGERLRLTDKGMDLANYVCVGFV